MHFKLSSVLRGHELDVRAVCRAVFPAEGILTASRDRTTRVWVQDGQNYTEGHVLAGHQNFISAVCTLPPSDKHPHGLIATGGHDNNILVWTLDSLEPLYTLTGHTGAVCSLVAGKFGTVLSGSWDNTAKVWINNKCVMTLKGHEAAVWAVELMPDHGLMLTGSADRTIKMWRAGSCEKTFSGHTDCVRGLAILSLLEFLSCSNDCTIRRWITTGECLQVYTGHTAFIYGIAVFPNDSGRFASVGEDRTLRIWEGGECSQTITIPAQSVWCVACLENGDIVTGSSDGVARVFTSEPDRFASPEDIKLFEQELASQAIPAQASGQIGDIKLEDLPGPEALLRPGKKSGQTIMVRKGQTVECHQWNEMEGKWEKVGEVVGAPGTTTTTSGNKEIYKGKEYDIIFNVEIQEGKPPLKLPFNYGDDPWVSAHNFLEDNDLSQLFLDQVVDFIVKNTKDVTIGQAAPTATDPLTGGSRYVPGSASSAVGVNQPSVNGGGAVDPFTGGGSYRPSYSGSSQSGLGTPFTGGNSNRPAPSAPTKTNKYFPKNDYVSFDNANSKAILGKINELNASVDQSQQFSEEDLQHITDLLSLVTSSSIQSSPSDKQLQVLLKGLNWPVNVLFPVLDVVRLAVRHQAVVSYFFGQHDTENIMERLLQLTRPHSPVPNVLLVYRTFVNLFSSAHGSTSLVKYREKIIEEMQTWISCPNKNVRVSLCTVLLKPRPSRFVTKLKTAAKETKGGSGGDRGFARSRVGSHDSDGGYFIYSVLLRKQPDLEAQTQCLSTLVTILQSEADNEARFRSLVAVGNLICSNDNSLSYARSLDLEGFLKTLVNVKEPIKVGECASMVLSFVSG